MMAQANSKDAKAQMKVSKTKKASQTQTVKPKPTKRMGTVYDAVAGRLGRNGFLKPVQLLTPNVKPALPEEHLLRRVGAPDELPYGFYDADERLSADQKLPDSDLLKAIHSYVSQLFHDTTVEGVQKDFRTFDETALLAMGVLLEEASKEVLGEDGDMALTEPEGLEHGLLESDLVKHQVIGTVTPRQVERKEEQSSESDDLEREQSPKKRRRLRI